MAWPRPKQGNAALTAPNTPTALQSPHVFTPKREYTLWPGPAQNSCNAALTVPNIPTALQCPHVSTPKSEYTLWPGPAQAAMLH